MAADLITLAEGALLTQFLTPTAKHYGEAALKRIQQLGDRAKAMLAGAGREPQGVEEKILFPLVQAASLETDPTLADLWAALLANAADPAQLARVEPGFAEVLRQLTPIQAHVFTAAALANSTVVGFPYKGHTESVHLLKQFAPLTQPEFHVVLGNLNRLGLCLSTSQQDIDAGSWLHSRTHYRTLGPGFDYLQVTPFGRAFLAAVAPPAP